MQLKPVESTNLAAVGYSRRTKQLQVQFKNNSTYVYHNVPAEVYHALLDAKSVGAYFAANIRQNYQFEKKAGKP